MIGAFFTIFGLAAVFAGLAAHGVIAPERAADCLVVLVVVLAIGWALGAGLVGSILRIAIPVVLVLVVAQYYCGGSRDAAVDTAAHVCAIGLSLFGIFIMVTGPFRK